MTTTAAILNVKLTADQFFTLGVDPPGVRLELIDGKIIVTPSRDRTHAQITQSLGYLLERHNRRFKLGQLYFRTDVVFNRYTVRRPDLAFYGTIKLHRMNSDRLTLPPDLCVAIVSPFNEDDD